MTPIAQPDSPRKRDAAKTRAAILSAAHVLFSRDGYDRVGVRDIAAAAGVNIALVNRYFGSKEKLFIAVIGDRFDISALLDGDRAYFGARLARYVIEKDETRRMDSITALLISAPGGAAAEHARAQLERQFIEPLAQWIGGRHALVRAGLIASHLLGLSMLRDMIKAPSLNYAETRPLVNALARTIQGIVEG
jgi:AcrR family transcriptional regulator